MHPLAAAELAMEQAAGDDDASRVRFRATTGHVHRTWARTFSSLPELYVRPQSEAEVEKAVTLARRCGRRVVVTGSGHSPSDLTCTSSWMVNLDGLGDVVSVDAEARVVVVQAGMRLRALGEALAARGLALANLGSIDEQSVAGAMATGTHGSSAHHGLVVSDAVAGLRITLAAGVSVACAADERPDLFAAALLSLGALGVVTQLTLRVLPAFDLVWRQTIDADAVLLDDWDRVWHRSEFVRAWWLPYTRRAVVWRADKTGDDDDDDEARPPSHAPGAGRRGGYYDGAVGRHVYHALLYLAQWAPRILPWVEWFVFGMQYGFADGAATAGVQPGREALLVNCLYPQFVNEWALPLAKGPEALRRLASWLHRLAPGDAGYVAHGIPFSADGLWVHAPVEVRVGGLARGPRLRPRPLLDPAVDDGLTLYLNATLYRPFCRDPPCRRRYYQAFEWLMRDLGGRPHWAKNFAVSRPDLEAMYGDRLDRFRRVRDHVDPDGMFVGPWHRRHIMPGDAPLPLEEVETHRREAPGGGLSVFGCPAS